MRWDDMYISSSAVALGQLESVDDAVANGRYEPSMRKLHDYASISIDDTRDAADMVADAALAAIVRSGVDPADIDVFLHAHVYSRGRELASYVQGRAAAGRARAVGVLQGCNGTIASLELGCLYLTADPGNRVAALTLGDKYDGERDRYSDDEGSVPGDGATAIVLARGDGVARVLTTEIVGDGRFNGLPPLKPTQFGDKQEFRAALRKRVVSERKAMSEAKRDCVHTALADAGVGADDVSHWLMSYGGRFMVDRDFYAEFGIDDERTTWEWGRTIGHVRGGDPVIGLTRLLETGAVKAGDRVAMLGDSSGFTFGCAVLEVVRQPGWPAGEEASSDR